ncbi:MAG TPA: HAD family hydrolase, partial [Thermoplasmata archaeon]|nr:HAD family hydrolase [Thermoplasmata archaeon]
MRAFFFDLDGTLIESKGIISELINETLMEFGYAPFTEDEMLASIGILLEGLFSLKADKEIVPKMCQCYVDKYLKTGLQKMKTYEGVVELLRELKDDKIKMGIVTTKSEEEAKQVTEHFGFSPYVDIIVGHSGKRKGKRVTYLAGNSYSR